MGGPGSGNRWRFDVKSTTENYHPLDVRRWARLGMLRPGVSAVYQWTFNDEVVASITMRAEEDQVILIYRHHVRGEKWTDEEYPVQIVRTPCNLGGSRQWFICPAVGCGRRVAILYGRGIFACRHCHQLAYPSSREDAGDRAARRAERLRARLDWRSGILNGQGDRPKWMRRRTFYRLRRKHDRLVKRCIHDAELRFGPLGLECRV